MKIECTNCNETHLAKDCEISINQLVPLMDIKLLCPTCKKCLAWDYVHYDNMKLETIEEKTETLPQF